MLIDIDLTVARHGEELSAINVMDEIRAEGVRCIGIKADLSDRDAAHNAIEQILAEFGRIDILVNNAGGAVTDHHSSGPVDTRPADLERLFDINFYSMVHCTQAAASALRRQGGAIVNISTSGTDRVPPGGLLAGYASAKASVATFTRSLAVELGPDGVRVNCIAPGIIESARVKAQAAARGLGTEAQAAGNPLRRLGRVDDCAGVLEFLVTDLSQYVTGECIRVSGGSTLTTR